MERHTVHRPAALVERLDRRVLLAANAVAGMYPFPSGESDFGDAPDTYGTTRNNDGAVHEVAFAEIRFGAGIDIENDGLPGANALGDDTNNGDDEDGVSLPTAAAPGSTIFVTMNVANEAGVAMAWIDFDGDGKFNTSDEIFDGPVSVGNNTFSVAVPAGAKLGDTYARFRVSNDVIPGPTGIGAAGEVEDYRIRIDTGAGGGGTTDFGDAPDTYGTTLAKDGARHTFQPGLILGKEWDAETDGQPSADALLDDNKPGTPDDEDGVVFDGDFRQGRSDTVLVTAGVKGSLSVWFDFNRDGTFDGGELAFQGDIDAGDIEIEIDVPSNAEAGETFMRFRFSDKKVDSPVGPAASARWRTTKSRSTPSSRQLPRSTMATHRSFPARSSDIRRCSPATALGTRRQATSSSGWLRRTSRPTGSRASTPRATTSMPDRRTMKTACFSDLRPRSRSTRFA